MVGIIVGSHTKPLFHNEVSQIAEQNRKSLATSAATHRSAEPNGGKVAMSSAQFVAIKLASSAAHLPPVLSTPSSSTQYLIGVVLGELVGDIVLTILPDFMAVEGANDADSRIPTMKKNFILMGVRMMMLMVREYRSCQRRLWQGTSDQESFFQYVRTSKPACEGFTNPSQSYYNFHII
jgi:hypothetical protein